MNKELIEKVAKLAGQQEHYIDGVLVSIPNNELAQEIINLCADKAIYCVQDTYALGELKVITEIEKRLK